MGSRCHWLDLVALEVAKSVFPGLDLLAGVGHHGPDLISGHWSPSTGRSVGQGTCVLARSGS